MKRSTSRYTLAAAALLLALVATPAIAQFPDPPDVPSDDSTFSIGKAIIWVEPTFAHLVDWTPGWNLPTPGHWSSPFMYDSNTVIGHSLAHKDGSTTDISGTPVGTAMTTVKDSDFIPGLNIFEGPSGVREIHTELYRLNLEEPFGCNMGFSIIAGTGMGVTPRSIGEVEAQSPAPSPDFPAESFFQVYVEVGTPFGTLFNVDPLAVFNGHVTSLPPSVVYIHGLTPAVEVFFKSGPHTGQRFGLLRLAGHQTAPGGQDRCQDPCGYCEVNEDLEDALNSMEMLECEDPDTCYEYHHEPTDPDYPDYPDYPNKPKNPDTRP